MSFRSNRSREVFSVHQDGQPDASHSRAVFCDVVLEDGADLRHDGQSWRGNQRRFRTLLDGPDDAGLTSILNALGSPVAPLPSAPAFASASTSRPGTPSQSAPSSPSRPDALMLGKTLDELLKLEQSYISRLRVLVNVYMTPIIGADRSQLGLTPHEGRLLFGNVRDIVAAHDHMLSDLQQSLAGPGGLHSAWADILRDHMTSFGPLYQSYISGQAVSQQLLHDLKARSQPFTRFVENARRASPADLHGSSLDSLLMEPVQRLPRYLLLFDNLLKYLKPADANVSSIREAMDVIRGTLHSESSSPDERAAIMWSLMESIEHFPAGLVGNSRQLVDAIDVDDHLGSSASDHGPSTTSTLHATLFLFTDSILIVKRSNPLESGRKLAGLDDLAGLVTRFKLQHSAPGLPSSSSGLPAGTPIKGARRGMSFRGLVPLLGATVTDLGNAGFNVTFARAPEQPDHERWTGRATRRYQPSIVKAPGLKSPQVEQRRFLGSIWQAQAAMLARESVVIACDLPSLARQASANILPSDGATQVFFVVTNRPSYTSTVAKQLAAVQIVESTSVPGLELGLDGGPHLIARLILHPDGRCTEAIRTRAKPSASIAEANAPTSILDFCRQVVLLGLYDSPPRIPGYDALPWSPAKSTTSAFPKPLASLMRSFGSGSLSSNGSISSLAASTNGNRRKPFDQMLRGNSQSTMATSSVSSRRYQSQLPDDEDEDEPIETLSKAGVTQSRSAEELFRQGEDADRDARRRRASSVPVDGLEDRDDDSEDEEMDEGQPTPPRSALQRHPTVSSTNSNGRRQPLGPRSPGIASPARKPVPRFDDDKAASSSPVIGLGRPAVVTEQTRRTSNKRTRAEMVEATDAPSSPQMQKRIYSARAPQRHTPAGSRRTSGRGSRAGTPTREILPTSASLTEAISGTLEDVKSTQAELARRFAAGPATPRVSKLRQSGAEIRGMSRSPGHHSISREASVEPEEIPIAEPDLESWREETDEKLNALLEEMLKMRNALVEMNKTTAPPPLEVPKSPVIVGKLASTKPDIELAKLRQTIVRLDTMRLSLEADLKRQKTECDQELDSALQLYNDELERLYADLPTLTEDQNALRKELEGAKKAQRAAEAECRAYRIELAARDQEIARLKATLNA